MSNVSDCYDRVLVTQYASYVIIAMPVFKGGTVFLRGVERGARLSSGSPAKWLQSKAIRIGARCQQGGTAGNAGSHRGGAGEMAMDGSSGLPSAQCEAGRGFAWPTHCEVGTCAMNAS